MNVAREKKINYLSTSMLAVGLVFSSCKTVSSESSGIKQDNTVEARRWEGVYKLSGYYDRYGAGDDRVSEDVKRKKLGTGDITVSNVKFSSSDYAPPSSFLITTKEGKKVEVSCKKSECSGTFNDEKIEIYISDSGLIADLYVVTDHEDEAPIAISSGIHGYHYDHLVDNPEKAPVPEMGPQVTLNTKDQKGNFDSATCDFSIRKTSSVNFDMVHTGSTGARGQGSNTTSDYYIVPANSLYHKVSIDKPTSIRWDFKDTYGQFKGKSTISRTDKIVEIQSLGTLTDDRNYVTNIDKSLQITYKDLNDPESVIKVLVKDKNKFFPHLECEKK